jgi:hypothetical protein
MSEATVEMRYYNDDTGRTPEWCVIHDGRVYPFGDDAFGKEQAEWAAHRIEHGKDSYRHQADLEGPGHTEELKG